MTKENIKPNTVPETLFIGVGGKGCDVITRVAKMCKAAEMENVNFVAFDTNVNDLSTVQGTGKRIYTVQTSNTQSVGDYLKYDKDAFDNWFPKNAVLYDKTVSEGAGQVRAISRLALNSTIKVGHIAMLYTAIDELFRKSGKSMKQALRIVFVGTTAGGTGSGMVLPTAMFVRNYIKEKYPNTAVVIRGFLMLPEILDSVIKTEVEKKSLRRNAYSTIKEINAFMMKGSGFFDIGGDLERYKNLNLTITTPGSEELSALDILPFDWCFLFDGQDAEDSTSTNLNQYLNQAAMALYEQNIGPMQKGAFSIEDNILKEISNPGNYGRNRFGGIGAGVLRYPYDDVAKYISYQWANSLIGGEGNAAKWSKIDKSYAVKKRQDRKNGVPDSESQSLADYYIDMLTEPKDPFLKDVYNQYLKDAEERVDIFLDSFKATVLKSVTDNSAISSKSSAVNMMRSEIDFSEDGGNRGKASEFLSDLKAYHSAVKLHSFKLATNKAETLLYNENKTVNEKNDNTIEYLLRSPVNGISHPNAARYILYKLKLELEAGIEDINAKQSTIEHAIKKYTDSSLEDSSFDAKYTKDEEATFEALCAAEKEDATFIEKHFKGYNEIYDQIKDGLKSFVKNTDKLNEVYVEKAAFSIANEYLQKLCEKYEQFFGTFTEKVAKIQRMSEDLVNSISFNKGDSVYNICADRALLDELTSIAMGDSEKMALSSELCGDIFDAIKQNVAFDRENQYVEVVENDTRVDIFDDVLLGYFENSVRENVDEIDVNIIDAIALEYRLKNRIKVKEEADGSSQLVNKVSHEDTIRYIKTTIARGARLAAPGIQRIVNTEPREINLCAYNIALKDLRSFRVDTLFPDGFNADGYNTISKYELHFFNALYNLTPDKLKKFAAPHKSEVGEDKNGGLYFEAYQEYSKDIGPDSSKSAVISTHIDKKWDSIAVLPEIDLDYQVRLIDRIHKAFIYGLLYEAIQFKEISEKSDNKCVYRYEDSNERTIDLVVSNGTLCDEFYEILDALYMNAAAVNDVYVICEEKRKKDVNKNSKMRDTTFYKAVKNFSIDQVHDGDTSLFEIPLYYYATLPNLKRYNGEISELVDSVINIFKDELETWEAGEDKKFQLCKILVKQYDLFIENFKKYDVLNNNTSTRNNVVVDIVYRKVKAIIKEVEPIGYEKIIDDLKAAIK